MRLSCTVSPTTNYNNTQRLSCTVSPTSKNRPPTTNNNSSQLTEILNVLHKLEGHITVLNSKVDRLTVEVISIRSEVSTIKTKVYGDVCYSEFSVPQRPFETIQQNNEFTSKLENEETFKQFMFSDNLAEQFSWRGTNTKQCIRGCRITLAIRHAFKNKFALEDEDFDKITQKHFQYAHDRLTKCSKYVSKKTKHDNEQLPP
ncbi:hypothetical protein CVS40_12925 [Lucilia cuprina]|nr:hypothetical protein CVS40_12925 [Lucilia cuprina]